MRSSLSKNPSARSLSTIFGFASQTLIPAHSGVCGKNRPSSPTGL